MYARKEREQHPLEGSIEQESLSPTMCGLAFVDVDYSKNRFWSNQHEVFMLNKTMQTDEAVIQVGGSLSTFVSQHERCAQFS